MEGRKHEINWHDDRAVGRIERMEIMSNHTTKKEIEFIKNLGKHNIHNENYSGPRDKETLLKGYLIGLEKREKWGEIDKEEAMAFVRKALES